VSAGVVDGEADRVALHLWVVTHGMVALELAGRQQATVTNLDRHYEEALGAQDARAFFEHCGYRALVQPF
jgi:hypothetical protein